MVPGAGTGGTHPWLRASNPITLKSRAGRAWWPGSSVWDAKNYIRIWMGHAASLWGLKLIRILLKESRQERSDGAALGY